MRRTDELPADLSLWMAIFDDGAEAGRLPRRLLVDLPRTSREDGSGGRGQSALWGTPLPDGRRLVLQLVFHPLCDFEHPFEAAGLATRLWPEPPPTLDVSTHRAVGPVGNAQLEGLFAKLGTLVGLPPDGRVHIHCRADFEPLNLRILFADEEGAASTRLTVSCPCSVLGGGIGARRCSCCPPKDPCDGGRMPGAAAFGWDLLGIELLGNLADRQAAPV
jgi:hypothetical protein